MKRRRVALFGGSFDPPHVGHALAVAYARVVGFELVLSVVVHRHAFGKPLQPFADRLQLARLAFAAIDGAEVSSVEETLPHPNYTLDTVHYLRRQHPEWDLQLLVGSDVLAEWHRWHGSTELARLAPPFVLGRAGYPTAEALPNLLPEVSSSEIRRRLAEQPRPQSDRWLRQRVPASVLEHIAARGLYRGD